MLAQLMEDHAVPTGQSSNGNGETHPAVSRGMRAALAASRRGEGWTSPNPIVGAALEIPGSSGRPDKGVAGFRSAAHLRFGGPHAEARLLAGQGMLQAGCVLYLTLEPCCHHGKTCPCVERILEAGPSLVVVASLDPNPSVAGKGIALLRSRGVQVRTGEGEIEAVALALPFHLYQTASRALIRLKMASTLDARLSDHRGASRWITGEEARGHVHRERSRADAVMIGSGTAVSDDPELTVRHLRGPQPSRIVVDSRLRTAPDSRLWRAWLKEVTGSVAPSGVPIGRRCGNYRTVETPAGLRYIREARLILATRGGHPPARLEPFRKLGWEIWCLPASRANQGGGVSMKALARRAGREGLLAILAEAGPDLAAGLLREDLADELLLYQAPTVLGGAKVWPGGSYAASLGRARSYERLEEKRLGRDLMVRLRRSGLLEGVRQRVHRIG